MGSRGLLPREIRTEAFFCDRLGYFSPVFLRFQHFWALNGLLLCIFGFFEGWAAVGAPAIRKIAALFRAGVIDAAAVVGAKEFTRAVGGFFQGQLPAIG